MKISFSGTLAQIRQDADDFLIATRGAAIDAPAAPPAAAPATPAAAAPGKPGRKPRATPPAAEPAAQARPIPPDVIPPSVPGGPRTVVLPSGGAGGLPDSSPVGVAPQPKNDDDFYGAGTAAAPAAPAAPVAAQAGVTKEQMQAKLQEMSTRPGGAGVADVQSLIGGWGHTRLKTIGDDQIAGIYAAADAVLKGSTIEAARDTYGVL